MSALTFTPKKSVAQAIDCRLLTPDHLADLTVPQIENLRLLNTKNAPKIADCFDVSGTNAAHIVIHNTHHQLNYIGHQMTKGQITIEGNCGDFLGSQMRGGTIICHGNANDRVGDQMRRGLILIDGNAGDYCASRLVAGTIGVFGEVGKYVGFAMKRGTILLTKTPPLHATIQNCGTHTLPFLALLFTSFQVLSTRFNTLKNLSVIRFSGDLACNGNGEILICQRDISA